MWGKLGLGLLALSFLPIWRRANIDEPLSFWDFMGIIHVHSQEHIPVEEAIRHCKEAYLQVYSTN